MRYSLLHDHSNRSKTFSFKIAFKIREYAYKMNISIYFYLIAIYSSALPISRLKQPFKMIQNRTFGTTVVKINVHLDSTALVALKIALASEFSMDLNGMNTVRNFFGGIFDIINEDIQNIGIQIRGDFSDVVLKDMPYDLTRCIEGNPVLARTNIVKTKLTAELGPKMGNTLVLLFCPERVIMPPTSALLNEGGCSNTGGAMFGELRTLKDVITDLVYKMISYGNSRPLDNTSNFERNAQRYVSECIGHEKNTFGAFERDLKAVRHLGTERYILKDGSKLKEHDLMDDVYLLRSRKRIVGHPTEDYSNDHELYTDFNKD
ncbi:hypothetical protein THOM_3181 [Trachipleistophora hominis]|uniref:Uncharacterized protein n=1 Tax=Trachipleistophora hominis TaxID=72359 RepID=L7JR02_TRAHO|nr:hypothetical protein THOM_3181 [Trachipleistophora hominis]